MCVAAVLHAPRAPGPAPSRLPVRPDVLPAARRAGGCSLPSWCSRWRAQPELWARWSTTSSSRRGRRARLGRHDPPAAAKKGGSWSCRRAAAAAAAAHGSAGRQPRPPRGSSSVHACARRTHGGSRLHDPLSRWELPDCWQLRNLGTVCAAAWLAAAARAVQGLLHAITTSLPELCI